jgi:hypothetical protein
MTIVEAATMWVPSVIANDGKVGASHLIRDACVTIEMPPFPSNSNVDETRTLLPEPSIQHLQSILSDKFKLQDLGKLARERALAWGELAYGEALLELASNMMKDKDHQLQFLSSGTRSCRPFN